MSHWNAEETIARITGIVGNPALADSLSKSITGALGSAHVHIKGGNDVWSIFESSLNAAIRDIENHPLGKLFRRLIEYGPRNPDDPPAPSSDGETMLSDLECATCVEFIYSHMINRFKGELAELLAISPVMILAGSLRAARRMPSSINLFFGDIIQEKRAKTSRDGSSEDWSGYAKGADGLITNQISPKKASHRNPLAIYGVIEVKSMYRSSSRLEAQLSHHLKRMAGGIRLAGEECSAQDIVIGYRDNSKSVKPVFIMVIPSNWKIDRTWWWEQQGDKRVMRFPESAIPTGKDVAEEIGRDRWKVRLAWSQEALNQAAYEMTFWYMSQVGRAVYAAKPLPKGWENMTLEEAGYNAIKMMLYYIPLRVKYMRPPGMNRGKLRKFRQRIDAKAIRLYNVYSFGYPLGVDSCEMLWPEDFADKK